MKVSVSCHSLFMGNVIVWSRAIGLNIIVFFILGTSSTNTVAPSTAPAPQTNTAPVSSSRKGTFTDDLHKLVDNWARDAMNLTGKKSSKTPGHPNYEVSWRILLPWCVITLEIISLLWHLYPKFKISRTLSPNTIDPTQLRYCIPTFPSLLVANFKGELC